MLLCIGGSLADLPKAEKNKHERTLRIEKINSKFHISWGFSTGAQLVGLLWLWRYTGYWAEDNICNHVTEDEVLLSCFEDIAARSCLLFTRA